jgi:hypothetical protein
MLRLAHALAPQIVELAVARTIERGFLRQEPEEPTSGNLHEPSSEWIAADGGFNRDARRRAVLKVRHAGAVGASVLGPGVLTWILLRRVKARRMG